MTTDHILLTAGLVCLIAAIVGGGLRAFGIEVPAMQSRSRQIALGVLGLILIVAGSVLNLETESTPEPTKPDIVSFYAIEPEIIQGKTTFLKWSVTGADTVKINDEVVDHPDGSKKISPEVTTNYVLVAKNERGLNQKPYTVIVKTPPVRPPKIVRFNVNETRITAGQTVTLSWEVRQANQVLLNNQKVKPVDQEYRNPTETTTYTLVAEGDKGRKDIDTKIVHVIPAKQPQLKGYLVVSSKVDIDEIGDFKTGDAICAGGSAGKFLRSFAPLSKCEIKPISSSEVYMAMQRGVCKATFVQQRESAHKLFPDWDIRLIAVYE